MGKLILIAVVLMAPSIACSPLGELETANTVSATITFVRSDTGARDEVGVDVPCVAWNGPEFHGSETSGGDMNLSTWSASGRLSSDGSRLLALSVSISAPHGEALCWSNSIVLTNLNLDTRDSALPMAFSGSLDIESQVAEASERDRQCKEAPIPMANPAKVTVTFAREDVSNRSCEGSSGSND